jgi:hypothetical protein
MAGCCSWFSRAVGFVPPCFISEILSGRLFLKLQGASKNKHKVTPNTAAYVKDGAIAIIETLEGLSPFIPVPLVSELMKISIRVLKACDVSVLQPAEGVKRLIISNRTRVPSKMTWGSFTDEFIL